MDYKKQEKPAKLGFWNIMYGQVQNYLLTKPPAAAF